jgi:glycosyltransferase involved in cell wall biosynthesis
MRVLHVITGLNIGGAEIMLYKIICDLSEKNVESQVISLTDIGKTGRKIEAMGIPVTALGMKRGIPGPKGLIRLIRHIKKYKPDIIQSWMYHADLLAGLAGWLGGKYPVIWNIRHSNLAPDTYKKSTIYTAKLCAKLSESLPTKIICCSEASRREHIKLGYTEHKMTVIPNGFDIKQYQPDEAARIETRKELEIDQETLVVGIVGRYDRQKDWPNFINAAKELVQLIREAGIEEDVRLLGERDEMWRVICSFDIATSASKNGEGFSNSIGEAMSCGVPCVVTDVGDSGIIVGDTGIVVKSGDSSELAYAWEQLIEEGDEGRRERGEKARKRIIAEYSIATIAERYKKLYYEVTERVWN